MTLTIDIHPVIVPVSLKAVLVGLDVQGFYAVDSQFVQTAESPLNLHGITAPSDDCEPDWLFVAIPGLRQHGIRSVYAAIEAGAGVVLTGGDSRAQIFE